MPHDLSPRTVVEDLVDVHGIVSLAEAYDVANAVGIEDQTLRLAIRRLIGEGAFTQRGRGRAGELRRTAGADVREVHDVEFVRLAYGLDAGDIRWDGRWHLLGVSVPEHQRSLRDRVRRTLMGRLGAGQVQPGLYVSPHPWQNHVWSELPDLADLPGVLVGEADRLRIGPHTRPFEVAAVLWPIDVVATGQRVLLDAAEQSIPRHAPRVALLAHALTLAHAFETAHAADPLLPPELLPDPWIGTRARAAFARSWADLRAELGDAPPLFARYEVRPRG